MSPISDFNSDCNFSKLSFLAKYFEIVQLPVTVSFTDLWYLSPSTINVAVQYN